VLPTPALAEIQRVLPGDRTAIAEFVAARGDTPSLWVVVTHRRAWHVPAPSMDDVTPRLRRLRGLVETSRSVTAVARELGRLLIDPLLPGLDAEGITELVIVADEALHLLPFPVLRLPDGRPLLERFALSTMPSMAVAADVWSRAAARPAVLKMLAYGDPKLSPAVTTTMGVPAALPGSRAEVRAASARYPSSVVRVGHEASERQFKRDASTSGASVVHLAVHGVVEAWDGRQAALALAADEGEDGLLYAGEVAALDLRAPLVVLSACRTDAGEVVAGEGVTGLTTAFLQAGARVVITTAWAIPDRGIVPLVDAFHAALASGQPVGEALRRAQLVSLRRGDPPMVWGSFSIVGDATTRVAGS
jgi:CHAT domain-containing protein